MAKKKEAKTNTMRILDKLNIVYDSISYECDEFKDGKQIADLLGYHMKRYIKLW